MWLKVWRFAVAQCVPETTLVCHCLDMTARKVPDMVAERLVPADSKPTARMLHGERYSGAAMAERCPIEPP